MLFATIKRLKMCVVTRIGLHRGNAFRYCCEQIFAEIVVNVEENIYLCFCIWHEICRKLRKVLKNRMIIINSLHTIKLEKVWLA